MSTYDLPDTISDTGNKKLNKTDNFSTLMDQNVWISKLLLFSSKKDVLVEIILWNLFISNYRLKRKKFSGSGGKSVFNMLTNVTWDSEFSGEKPDDIIKNTFKLKSLW